MAIIICGVPTPMVGAGIMALGGAGTAYTATIKDQFLEKMASAISVALNLATAVTRARIIG